MALPALKGFLPAHATRVYRPLGRCLYCGSVNGLSDEHIIPLGLGGRFVLPRASCSDCSTKTSKLERTCLRTMFGPLRLLYDLPSRRKRDRPKSLLLKVRKTESSEWEYVPVAQDHYPFLITFPYFDAPGALTPTPESDALGPVTDRLWIRGASPHHDFDELAQIVAQELGVDSLMPESKAEVSAFCSLLAKIALAYVAAETAEPTANTKLARIALGESMDNCRHFIGSVAKDEPPTSSLHEISQGKQLPMGTTLVRLRLLAKLGTPTYFIALPPESRNHVS